MILWNAGFTVLFVVLLLISYDALERSVPAWAARVCGQLLIDAHNPLCADLLAASDSQLDGTPQSSALTTLRMYEQMTVAPRLGIYGLVAGLVGLATLLTLTARRLVPRVLPLTAYSPHLECPTCGRWLADDSICTLCYRYLSIVSPPLLTAKSPPSERIYTYADPIELPIILRRGAAQSPINNLQITLEMSPLFIAALNDPPDVLSKVQLTPLIVSRNRERAQRGIMLTWSDQADCLDDKPQLELRIALTVTDKAHWSRDRRSTYPILINAQADLMTPVQATNHILLERPATRLEQGASALRAQMMRLIASRQQPTATPGLSD